LRIAPRSDVEAFGIRKIGVGLDPAVASGDATTAQVDDVLRTPRATLPTLNAVME
jgi:predicted phage gp36 major capsid-like protein